MKEKIGGCTRLLYFYHKQPGGATLPNFLNQTTYSMETINYEFVTKEALYKETAEVLDKYWVGTFYDILNNEQIMWGDRLNLAIKCKYEHEAEIMKELALKAVTPLADEEIKTHINKMLSEEKESENFIWHYERMLIIADKNRRKAEAEENMIIARKYIMLKNMAYVAAYGIRGLKESGDSIHFKEFFNFIYDLFDFRPAYYKGKPEFEEKSKEIGVLLRDIVYKLEVEPENKKVKDLLSGFGYIVALHRNSEYPVKLKPIGETKNTIGFVDENGKTFRMFWHQFLVNYTIIEKL